MTKKAVATEKPKKRKRAWGSIYKIGNSRNWYLSFKGVDDAGWPKRIVMNSGTDNERKAEELLHESG
jgi:hypothetical protein